MKKFYNEPTIKIGHVHLTNIIATSITNDSDNEMNFSNEGKGQSALSRSLIWD